MPYKCVHCSSVFKDGANEVLSGCACGSKFFFYIKEEKIRLMAQREKDLVNLSPSEKKQIEEDVREIAGITDEDKLVFLDFESVKVVKPGKYLLDLGKLFSTNKLRIYQLEDGKYIVDLSSKQKEDN